MEIPDVITCTACQATRATHRVMALDWRRPHHWDVVTTAVPYPALREIPPTLPNAQRKSYEQQNEEALIRYRYAQYEFCATCAQEVCSRRNTRAVPPPEAAKPKGVRRRAPVVQEGGAA